MKFDKSKIIELEDNLKFKLSEKDFKDVVYGIEELTKKMETLLEVDADKYEKTYSVFQNEHTNSMSSNLNEIDKEQIEMILERSNNFQGGYFKIGQVINDD